MLEATMVLLDNSEYAINEDMAGSTRWTAQLDAVKTVFNARTQTNPENVVGLVTMAVRAGGGPEVLASATQNYGAIVSAMSEVRLDGSTDLITSIQVAQLALKHRQNKNLRQRVIAFVGSPLEGTSAADLVKLGKRLKKNNVACDVVNFGEDAENEEKLREFIEAVNSQDNSRLVTVPAGTVLLSDMLLSSGMLSEDGVPQSNGTGPSGGAGGSNDDGEYGVDPNLDPELAMALRMSLEEERARQAATSRTEGQASESNLAAIPEQSTSTSQATQSASAGIMPPDLSAAAASGPASAPPVTAPPADAAVGPADTATGVGAVKGEELEDEMQGNEDDDLARALALSRAEDVDMADAGESSPLLADQQGDDEDEEMTEDEAMARAIAMSMQDQENQGSK